MEEFSRVLDSKEREMNRLNRERKERIKKSVVPEKLGS
jgi:hypothetical protein